MIRKALIFLSVLLTACASNPYQANMPTDAQMQVFLEAYDRCVERLDSGRPPIPMPTPPSGRFGDIPDVPDIPGMLTDQLAQLLERLEARVSLALSKVLQFNMQLSRNDCVLSVTSV